MGSIKFTRGGKQRHWSDTATLHKPERLPILPKQCKSLPGQQELFGDDERAAQPAEATPTPLESALAALPVPDEDWQQIALARGLLRGYDRRWKSAQQQIVVVGSERTYHSPLFNPESQRQSRTFTLAGKVDKLAEDRGLCLFDHKTTSSDIADLDSPYWRQLAVDSQPSHYELLLHFNGLKIERVVWDVVRKPGIKPRALKKAEQAEIASLGTYFESNVSAASQEHAARHRDENAELFENRVAWETMKHPNRYFARRNAKRIREELAEYATELWDVATEIREARRTDRWYRNSGACLLYNTPCQFLGICSGHDTVDSDKWTRAEQVHNELDLGDDGRGVLTHSRLRLFQTCRRKHYYHYELGIRRVDEKETAPIQFGRLFHQALDVYWRIPHGNRSEGPVSAVDRPAEDGSRLSG